MNLNLPEKRYYSIGEVSKAFNVNPSLLRFWEKEFDEIKPKKKESGTRKYTPENINILKLIYHLVKEKGLTISGAKKQLKVKDSKDVKISLLSKLEKIKVDLNFLKSKL
ncbi:MAG: MerR family transcriptional regulator [Flavobacteriaceae bacterium]|tara:strand:- start:9 stop:335 length:327 start_codon:yes stop_codon:yes gene_type:complete